MSGRHQIRPWLLETFGGPEPKLFIELGGHIGEDTAWLANIPNVRVHTFEPDPRNHQPRRWNVTRHVEAIASHTGTCNLVLASNSASSSIHKPKDHLLKWPHVTFGPTIRVPCTSLNRFFANANIDRIDFIWADIQGAEGDMIRGGRKALARTRYLFTEACPDGEQWYEGQITFSELLAMLPRWRVLRRWPRDVLLENTDAHRPLDV